ncbi:MAG: replicative DNA helicase, partial [Planctomycetaceae bacterium]|nr:replicative DNA helicase [Planctomycetaceae bacterium]
MSDLPAKKTKRVKKQPDSAEVLPLLGQPPPHDYSAEQAVLGALLHDPDICDDVIQILRDPDDFSFDPHRRIYSQLMKMRIEDSKIDLLLLVNRLSAAGDLEAVGGHAFLAELMEAVPITAHAEHYANIVKEKATLRKLIHAGAEIIRDAYAPETATKELLNKAAVQMAELCESQTVNQISDMTALMNDVAAFMDRKAQGFVEGVKTGFVDLDDLIEGLHPNELIILAARPGMGKTALALNIAENVAVNERQAVLFASLEMGKLELALRLICSRGTIDSGKIRRNLLSHDEQRRFMEVADELAKAPMFIDDTPSRTIAEIAAVARKLKRQQDLRLLVIDYIGLISPEDNSDPRQEQVAKIARRLKTLARELHVPILCLAQLNRQVEAGRKDERPRLSHLRESGAIEQDADVVMFVHRLDAGLDAEKAAEKDLTNQVDLIVAKQRNGATDDVRLIWDGPHTRFFNAAARHTEEYADFA